MCYNCPSVDHHNELNGTEGNIESPHYPTKLESNDMFSWRITVDSEYVVMLTVDYLQDLDVQHIHFYDGYTSIGVELVPELYKPMISNMNVMYITATRGPFKLHWHRLSKEALESNRTAELQLLKCGNQLITFNRPFNFQSPGYPSGYATNLHCVWDMVPLNPAVHAILQLMTLDLEVFSAECLTDYVVISSSSDLQNWTQLDKICSALNATKQYNGRPYLRIEFVTDGSVNETGFRSMVLTGCGSELKDSQGWSTSRNSLATECCPSFASGQYVYVRANVCGSRSWNRSWGQAMAWQMEIRIIAATSLWCAMAMRRTHRSWDMASIVPIT